MTAFVKLLSMRLITVTAQILIIALLLGCATTSGHFTMEAPPAIDLKEQGVESIGVLPFSWPDGNGEQIADLFSARLAAGGYFTVVERAKLEAALKEQGIGRVGMPDEKAGRKLGRVLGVDALLSGRVLLQQEQARVIVSYRVTKTDTGEVVSAKRLTVRAIDALREYSRQTGKPPSTDMSRGTVLTRMVHLAVDRLLEEILPHPVKVDREFEEGRALFDDRTITRGIEFMKANRPREAILLWEMVLEQDPENTAAYYNLGIAYESLREFDKAEKAFRKADLIKPKPRYSQAAEEAKAAALARLKVEPEAPDSDVNR